MQPVASPEMVPEHADSGQGPRILRASLEVFRSLDAEAIRYCHFKSNEHLGEGLAGTTDLDVLVDHRHAQAAQGTLLRSGFKRFQTGFAGAYPGVEDYLGIDRETGRLVHLHVHYALVIGEKHLKGYQLGSGDALLEDRVRDPETGVFTSDPERELQLLLLRFALKLRWRDFVLEGMGRPFFRAGALREYHWLQRRVDRTRLHRITRDELGVAAAARIDRLVDTLPSARELRALRRSVGSVLARSRTYGRIEGPLLRVSREVAATLSGATRRWLGASWPLRRTSPTGGRIVALLGPDGSGKSTLAREVRLWLSWKLDAREVYFGSGDGPASPLRWLSKLALRAARRLQRLGPARQGSGPPHAAPSEGGERIPAMKGVWAAVLALEKRSRMRAAVRARNRGLVVVCDRYPQIDVLGFNDGPLLAPWRESRSTWRRRLAAWEHAVYAWAAANPPDLAIKLDVCPDVAVARKAGTLGEAERRRAALRRIEYGRGCDHVVIEAGRPLDEVLLEVKCAVWDRL